jgi:uncharacterized protein (DUF58 family)
MLRRALFQNFRLVHDLGRWARLRLTSAGMLAAGGVIAAGVFSIDTRQTLAFQIFALCAALLLLSFIGSLFRRAGPRITRLLPEYATVGQAIQYRLIAQAPPRHRPEDFTLEEELDFRPPTFTEFLHVRGIADSADNWFDRVVGYPRWLALLRDRRGASIAPAGKPLEDRDGNLVFRQELVPLRRGYVQFRRTWMKRPDPLGLVNAVQPFANPQHLLILPKRYPIPAFQLPGRRRYQPGGMQAATAVGDSQEFVALRDYRPGDPLRRMHWRSLAKTGQPIVKEYQDEYFVRQALILDVSLGDGPAELFEAAISVAASLATTASEPDALHDLIFAGDGLHCITSGRGLATQKRLLEILACLEPRRDLPFSAWNGLILDQAGALSCAVCILLELDAERSAFLDALRQARVPLLVLHIVAGQDAGNAPAAIARQPYMTTVRLRARELATDLQLLRGITIN